MLRPGDMVIQPPEIRHRVLESSDGLEVVEIGCPADHITIAVRWHFTVLFQCVAFHGALSMCGTRTYIYTIYLQRYIN